MDVLEEVQPLWTYLRKCNLMDVLEEVLPLWTYPYGRTSGSATLMDVLEEVQPLWTYLRLCNPYGRT